MASSSCCPHFTSAVPKFFKVILPHVLTQKILEVPKTFVRKHREVLQAEEVCLKVASGAEWIVGLRESNEEVWFEKGWQDFVKFYSVDIGYLLTFKYEGNFCFHVIIFDQSASEIEYPMALTEFDNKNIFDRKNKRFQIPKNSEREKFEDDGFIQILGNNKKSWADDNRMKSNDQACASKSQELKKVKMMRNQDLHYSSELKGMVNESKAKRTKSSQSLPVLERKLARKTKELTIITLSSEEEEIPEKMIEAAESKNLETRQKAGEKRVREETTSEVKRTKRNKETVEHKNGESSRQDEINQDTEEKEEDHDSESNKDSGDESSSNTRTKTIPHVHQSKTTAKKRKKGAIKIGVNSKGRKQKSTNTTPKKGQKKTQCVAETNKDGLYLMPSSRRNQPLKINLQAKFEVVDKIKSTLSESLQQRFRKTCFGHFLDFSITNQSSQLLLHLIQRQCKPKNSRELNFFIGGKVLRFGLREFALVTGLNCGPIPKIDVDKLKEKSHMRNTYFKEKKNVSRRYLNMVFQIFKHGPDDDRIKMAQLYFLESFLLPKQDIVNVDINHILMVDDEELFNNYPWGRLAFNLLVEYMQKAILSKGASGISMGGFIFPILAWAYELIPTLSTTQNFFARKLTNKLPRIINWVADTQPKWKDLERKVFESPELEICPLIASPEEMKMKYFEPFIVEEEKLMKELEIELGTQRSEKNVVDLTFIREDQTLTRELIEKLDKIEKNQQVMLKRLESFEKLNKTINLIIDCLKIITTMTKPCLELRKVEDHTDQEFGAITNEVYKVASEFDEFKKELDDIEREIE